MSTSSSGSKSGISSSKSAWQALRIAETNRSVAVGSPASTSREVQKLRALCWFLNHLSVAFAASASNMST
jgi:hypothetical protein